MASMPPEVVPSRLPRPPSGAVSFTASLSGAVFEGPASAAVVATDAATAGAFSVRMFSLLLSFCCCCFRFCSLMFSRTFA